MSWAMSRRRSPSTFRLASIHVRRRVTSSSVRSRTRVSGFESVSEQTRWAWVRPTPKMYVREISNRFSRGMSTPEIRATRCPFPSLVLIPSALALLVPRVLADHHDHPVPPDDLAFLADRLDARSYLHCLSCPFSGPRDRTCSFPPWRPRRRPCRRRHSVRPNPLLVPVGDPPS